MAIVAKQFTILSIQMQNTSNLVENGSVLFFYKNTERRRFGVEARSFASASICFGNQLSWVKRRLEKTFDARDTQVMLGDIFNIDDMEQQSLLFDEADVNWPQEIQGAIKDAKGIL